MPRRKLAGIAKELIVALGFEDFRTFASGAILLDAFYEAGGNLFDTDGLRQRLYGEAARRMAHQSRRARAVRRHRQGRAYPRFAILT